MSSIIQIGKKVTSPLGFQKGYNVILFIIFGGALMGFALARFQFLSFKGVFCKPLSTLGAAPGECYWYKQDLYKAGILLHLGCMLPASFLAAFQFVPSIRHHLLIFHRMNGYIIILLTLVGNAGAIIIARHVFGGTVATQTLVGTLFLMSTFGILNAYYNIKCLQIDQHRAWMLRTFAWMGSIITARVILITMIHAISSLPAGYNFYDNRSCDELISIAGPDPVYAFYPECVPGFSNSTTAGRVILRATWNSDNPFEKVAVAGLSFPATVWLSLALHVLGIELYLAFTPREGQRLRQISYERQLARGMKNPGSAGLVPEKFADADPWVPKLEDREIQKNKESSSRSSGDDFANIERSITDSVRIYATA
ncbi:hypothetical protein M501DRAFT_1040784 [Patellaria atrata CBS 101060]|uniref:Microtubule associated protein n=1 Tax=Patellaria atrata CBS 101060 TaxID=1346257 RepID=A0A9P4S645_9PEZI|nr:hypothetical protein M501DRAFT_1040784 [Patellaria atrata CBS 101060]